MARRSGAVLPPYETRDTLIRLAADLETTKADTVVCLGDSFDDADAARALSEAEKLWIARLQAGRRWIWIEGNHDPGPIELGGTHLSEFSAETLTFRHIANPQESGEISGHYHPKARLTVKGRSITRQAFLLDQTRVIVPAYGTYTGGVRSCEPPLTDLMSKNAIAILTGSKLHAVPMPR